MNPAARLLGCRAGLTGIVLAYLRHKYPAEISTQVLDLAMERAGGAVEDIHTALKQLQSDELVTIRLDQEGSHLISLTRAGLTGEARKSSIGGAVDDCDDFKSLDSPSLPLLSDDCEGEDS